MVRNKDDKNTFPPPFLLPKINFTSWFPVFLHPPHQATQAGWGNGGCGQSMAFSLYCSFFLTLFPCSIVGPSHGLQFLQVKPALVWPLQGLQLPSEHIHVLWCQVLHELQCGYLLQHGLSKSCRKISTFCHLGAHGCFSHFSLTLRCLCSILPFHVINLWGVYCLHEIISLINYLGLKDLSWLCR